MGFHAGSQLRSPARAVQYTAGRHRQAQAGTGGHRQAQAVHVFPAARRSRAKGYTAGTLTAGQQTGRYEEETRASAGVVVEDMQLTPMFLPKPPACREGRLDTDFEARRTTSALFTTRHRCRW